MKTRNLRQLFQGLVVNIEQMEVSIGQKGWFTYQVVRHPGGVGVLPLHADGTVTLIRQLRPSVGKELLEIPAGRLDPGEDPRKCGERELMEETGLTAASFLSLGSIYPSPGVLDEEVRLFLATDLTEGASAPEEYEDIQPVRISLIEALSMADSGEITDAKTIVALIRAARKSR